MKRLAQKSASPDIAINDKNKIKAIISGVIIMLLSVVLFFGGAGCQNNAAQPEPLDAPENLHIEGKMLLWDDVKNASGYVVYVDRQYVVYVDRHEYYVSENYYDLSYLAVEESYKINVSAIDDCGVYDDSAAAEIMYYSEYVEEECYDEAGLKYVLLEDGSGYEASKGSSDMEGESRRRGRPWPREREGPAQAGGIYLRDSSFLVYCNLSPFIVIRNSSLLAVFSSLVFRNSIASTEFMSAR